MPNTHTSISGQRNTHQRLHCTAHTPSTRFSSVSCQMASSRKTLLVAAALMAAAVALLLPAIASAKTTFTVGDGEGWDVGVDYRAWAKGKKFKVGDTLVFRYNSAQDVASVDAKSFAECTTPDNAQVFTSGNDHLALGGRGSFFFISQGEGACDSGMKLAIHVS